VAAAGAATASAAARGGSGARTGGDREQRDEAASGSQTPTLPTAAAAGAPVRHAAAAAEAAAPGPVSRDAERFQQLVEGLHARLRASGAADGRPLRMTLRPQELGEVVVRLQVTEQGATATLVAHNADGARMLAESASELRQALADRGLQLDRLDVSTGGRGEADARPGQSARQGGDQAPRTLYAFRAAADAPSPSGTSPVTVDADGNVSYLA
jgi:flagellar hook-length control protein FliK